MAWSRTHVLGVPIRYIVYVCVIIVVLSWLRLAPPTAPWSPQAVRGYILGEPRVIERVVKEIVPGPVRIKIVPKEKIVTIYRDLPTPSTVSDPNSQVVAVATIPSSPDGGVAVAVLHTGGDNVAEGHIEYRPSQAPFFKVKRAFSAEGWYFPAGNRVAEAALVANPLRIGPIEVKAKAGIDMERETSTLRGFVGVGVEYKF